MPQNYCKIVCDIPLNHYVRNNLKEYCYNCYNKDNIELQLTSLEYRLSLKAYCTLYLIQALLLLIGIYIYSIISSKFITTPLKSFITSIKKFKKLDYDIRADQKGLTELQDVQNEFNEMLIKLKKVEEENKRIDKSLKC